VIPLYHNQADQVQQLVEPQAGYQEEFLCQNQPHFVVEVSEISAVVALEGPSFQTQVWVDWEPHLPWDPVAGILEKLCDWKVVFLDDRLE